MHKTVMFKSEVMFNLFKRQGLTDLEWMGTDLHSHLLPGIDDGVQNAYTGVRFIKSLMGLGLKQFILTPHVYDEVYPNTSLTIDNAHEVLYKEMQSNGLENIYTHSSGEYMLDAQFNYLLNSGKLRPFPTNHILIEMPWATGPIKLGETVLQIKCHGYLPIMAHPERYPFYFNRPEMYHKLKEIGCLLQLNLLSPVGYYGKDVTKAANYLIKNNLIDLVGTDLHHERHLNKLFQFVKSGKAYKELGHLNLKNRELFD